MNIIKLGHEANKLEFVNGTLTFQHDKYNILDQDVETLVQMINQHSDEIHSMSFDDIDICRTCMGWTFKNLKDETLNSLLESFEKLVNLENIYLHPDIFKNWEKIILGFSKNKIPLKTISIAKHTKIHVDVMNAIANLLETSETIQRISVDCEINQINFENWTRAFDKNKSLEQYDISFISIYKKIEIPSEFIDAFMKHPNSDKMKTNFLLNINENKNSFEYRMDEIKMK